MIAAIETMDAAPSAADRIHRRLFQRSEARLGRRSFDTRNSTRPHEALRQNLIRTSRGCIIAAHVVLHAPDPTATRAPRRDARLDVRRDGFSDLCPRDRATQSLL